ncbi:MAG: hypothetical protein LBK52_07240 [Deltaproteobacteria bacterium]|jgi:hypothetical protein|nr:hypothetical protein [Deltaproteobacteria bacterium]
MAGNEEITLEQARAALADPVKGSLSVLKALGKARDIFRTRLMAGERRLEARSPLEQAAAEAAVADWTEELREDGRPVPEVTVDLPGSSGITLEQARAALADPVNGSLRVLKALGKSRDQFRVLLAAGQRRLKAVSPLEQAAAEAAAADLAEEFQEDGRPAPEVVIERAW